MRGKILSRKKMNHENTKARKKEKKKKNSNSKVDAIVKSQKQPSRN